MKSSHEQHSSAEGMAMEFVELQRQARQNSSARENSSSLVDYKIRASEGATTPSPFSIITPHDYSGSSSNHEMQTSSFNRHNQQCWRGFQSTEPLVDPTPSYQYAPIQQHRHADHYHPDKSSLFAEHMLAAAARSNQHLAPMGGEFQLPAPPPLAPSSSASGSTFVVGDCQSHEWRQQVGSQLAACSQLEATIQLMLRDSHLRQQQFMSAAGSGCGLLSASSASPSSSSTPPSCSLQAPNQHCSLINTTNQYAALALSNYASSLTQTTNNLASGATTQQLLASSAAAAAALAGPTADTIVTPSRPSNDATITNMANRQQLAAGNHLASARCRRVSHDESNAGAQTITDATRVASQQQHRRQSRSEFARFGCAAAPRDGEAALLVTAAPEPTTTTTSGVVDNCGRPEVVERKHNNRVFEIHQRHHNGRSSSGSPDGDTMSRNEKAAHRDGGDETQSRVEEFGKPVHVSKVNGLSRGSPNDEEQVAAERERSHDATTTTAKEEEVRWSANNDERSLLMTNNGDEDDDEKRKNKRDIDRPASTALSAASSSSPPSLKLRGAKSRIFNHGANNNNGVGTNKSDNDNNNPNNSRVRTAYSSIQILNLEREFSNSMYLSRIRRIELAQKLDLSEKQVKIWFQNRRVKYKKENYHA